MIRRIKNSWLLLEQSLVVLSQNKKLLVFPFVTMAATLGILLFFLGTFLFQPTGHAYNEKAHWKTVAFSVFTEESVQRLKEAKADNQNGEQRRRLDRDQREQLDLNKRGIAWAAALYFLSMFLATFFNVAFYHEILEALNGRPVGIRQGFAFAMTRVGPIFMWSLFAGAVGYLIKSLEERLGIIGKIVVRLIGLAWSVAAVFAIPVIICGANVSNPLTVLRTSAMALKKTWGETLIGFLGIQAGTILVLFGSAVPFVAVVLAGVSLNMPLIAVAGVMGWLMFIVLFAYLSSVAGNVFHCALYLFAANGTPPAGYDREMMNAAWKFKKI